MRKTRRLSLLAMPLAGALAITACGSSSKSSSSTTAGPTTTAATTTTAGGAQTTAAGATTTAGGSQTTAAGGATDVDLKAAGCPATIGIQTDWNPESEHGNLYQLVGPNPTVDTAKKTVTGELLASGGKDTGVKIQIRAGGPAIGFQQVTSQLYQDPSLLLGFTSTDESIQNSKTNPTISIVAPFLKNPQVILWDPATYPTVQTIDDLGTKGIKVRYFSVGAYMDYLTGKGILKKSQVDGSYDGTPAAFVADQGKAATQGFSSAEPYIWQNEVKAWGKPLKYAYIDDTGWKPYAQSLGTKPENITKFADCFKKLVPIVQQGAIDFVKDPTAANALILDLVTKYNNGWTYDAGVAKYAVDTIVKDKLIANSPDGTLGSFDTQRVTDLIAIAGPIYATGGKPIKDGLTAADVVTNQFIDKSIHL